MASASSLKTVIVPTDFSAGARRALARVALLPLPARAVVHIVHVNDDRKSRRPTAEVQRSCERARAQLAALARAARRPVPAIEVKILSGTAHVEIIRFARSVDAGLVVLGRKGAGDRFKQVLGRPAAQVALKSDIAVLVVGPPPKRAHQRPLLALQLDPSIRGLFSLAREVVPAEVRSLLGVHAFHVPFEGLMGSGTDAQPSEHHLQCRAEADRRLKEFLAAANLKGFRLSVALRRGEPAWVILREARQQKSDLIILGTHGRVGIAHALLGSVAESVVIGATRDVLVAPPVRHTFEDV